MIYLKIYPEETHLKQKHFNIYSDLSEVFWQRNKLLFRSESFLFPENSSFLVKGACSTDSPSNQLQHGIFDSCSRNSPNSFKSFFLFFYHRSSYFMSHSNCDQHVICVLLLIWLLVLHLYHATIGCQLNGYFFIFLTNFFFYLTSSFSSILSDTALREDGLLSKSRG